jgi:hypothetical protein
MALGVGTLPVRARGVAGCSLGAGLLLLGCSPVTAMVAALQRPAHARDPAGSKSQVNTTHGLLELAKLTPYASARERLVDAALVQEHLGA